jgi:alkylation response protein AidB-like acyl-CoA dehydrogenase
MNIETTVTAAKTRLPDQSPMLDRIRSLIPEISARAAETEKERGVPADLIEKLKEAGLFRMLYPKSMGGEELNPVQACRIIEELARADGSAGWNAMVAYGFNVALSRYPKSAIERIFANGPDVKIRGAQAPLGKARAVDGGYMIGGKWPFGSGSFTPEWVMASGILLGSDGKPQFGPGGIPDMRIGLFPNDAVEWLDTWDAVGMRGSSSHDFQFEEQFVAEELTTNIFDPTRPSSLENPWLSLPFYALAAPTHSAVVIGIAQGAIEEVTAASQTKKSAFNPAAILADDPLFQDKLGEVSARIYALRTALDQSFEDYVSFVESGEPAPMDMILRATALASITHFDCLKIIDDLFTMMGSTPCYTSSTLQRRWRDVRVALQHVSASKASWGRYGAALLGRGPFAAPK